VGKKVVFCVPTITRPYQVCLDSLRASLPLIEEAGWEHLMANSIGCPYISRARATMLRKAQDAGADVIVFIDHDLSWKPEDLLRLIETPGDVIAGTYRFKQEPEEYMGSLIPDINQRPQVRSDGCVLAHCVPAGFLKITRQGLAKFMFHYPELQYIEEGTLTVDLFNHGVHKGVWWGEDYAFSRNWNEKCGQIWVIPDLDLNHHTHDAVFPGNFHRFLLRQDGGSESANPQR
jgi:glycosyltransferase involved in cell wall biosynthesis